MWEDIHHLANVDKVAIWLMYISEGWQLQQSCGIHQPPLHTGCLTGFLSFSGTLIPALFLCVLKALYNGPQVFQDIEEDLTLAVGKPRLTSFSKVCNVFPKVLTCLDKLLIVLSQLNLLYRSWQTTSSDETQPNALSWLKCLSTNPALCIGSQHTWKSIPL